MEQFLAGVILTLILLLAGLITAQNKGWIVRVYERFANSLAAKSKRQAHVFLSDGEAVVEHLAQMAVNHGDIDSIRGYLKNLSFAETQQLAGQYMTVSHSIMERAEELAGIYQTIAALVSAQGTRFTQTMYNKGTGRPVQQVYGGDYSPFMPNGNGAQAAAATVDNSTSFDPGNDDTEWLVGRKGEKQAIIMTGKEIKEMMRKGQIPFVDFYVMPRSFAG